VHEILDILIHILVYETQLLRIKHGKMRVQGVHVFIDVTLDIRGMIVLSLLLIHVEINLIILMQRLLCDHQQYIIKYGKKLIEIERVIMNVPIDIHEVRVINHHFIVLHVQVILIQVL
jgi:hypothetical protein